MTEFVTDKRLIEILISIRDLKEKVGGKFPKEGWEKSLENFQILWTVLKTDLNLSMSNKVHIITEHIPQYIASTGYGLAMVSDQGVESMHQGWKF